MNDTKKALSCLTLTVSDIGNDTVLCQQVQRDEENLWRIMRNLWAIAALLLTVRLFKIINGIIIVNIGIISIITIIIMSITFMIIISIVIMKSILLAIQGFVWNESTCLVSS